MQGEDKGEAVESLADKVAIVTGASKGMGRVFARRLVEAGARVAALARPSAQLDALRAEAGSDLLTIECDITKPDQANDAVAACVAHFGKLDLLVNNAAIFRPFLIEKASNSDITDHFETNVFGPIWMTRAAIPHLRQTRGQIITMSSESVTHPFPMLATYAATKAAVETLSSALADELRADGIRITVLRSGSVSGGSGGDHWSAEATQAFYAKIMETGHAQMAGESATPESMAEALIAVASLPADLCPRLFDVRAALAGIPEGAKGLQ
jgi:NAD(P)-dependent dehydrogenase (short-subunit alcohol dehydrogenase family)